MRNLVWLGEPYFANHLADCGWENVKILPDRPQDPLSSWTLQEQAGFEPDVIVAVGAAGALSLLGPASLPCLTVFYEPAAEISPYAPALAQAFDAVVSVHRQNVASFPGQFLAADRVFWLPAFAGDVPFPGAIFGEPIDTLLLDARQNLKDPATSAFIEQFRERVGKIPARGKAAAGSILLLQPDPGVLGFEFFAALANGVCVLMPRVENGLETLFVDGEHYVGFAPDEVGDALYRYSFLLNDPELASYIADTGQAEVRTRHTALNRAQEFTDFVCDLALMDCVAARCGKSPQIVERELAPVFLSELADIPERTRQAHLNEMTIGVPYGR